MSEEISNHSKAEEQKKKLNLQKRLLEKELVTSREKEERNKKEQFHFQKQIEDLSNQIQRFNLKNQKLEQIVRRLEYRV